MADGQAQRTIAMYELGRKHKQDQEDRARAEEERKLEMDLYKHKIAQMKIDDRLKAALTNRDLAMDQVKTMQGQPGQEVPISSGLRESLLGMKATLSGVAPAPGVSAPTAEIATPAEPISQFPNAPENIPGFDIGEYHAPSMQVTPQTQEQVRKTSLAQQMIAMAIKARQLQTEEAIKAQYAKQIPGRDVPFIPAVLAQQKELKTLTPTPGRDIPYPADVQAQRMAAQTARYSSTATDIKDTAQGIMDGDLVPDLTKYSFRDRTAIAAELQRAGFSQTQANLDWKAIERHISTLNGVQQERLRQAITFTYDSLDVLEQLYNDWKSTGLPGGFKLYNKAALVASANMPGESGAKAQALMTQINDLTSELGTVYKGGNSSTDESLKLAAENLKAEWNDATFKKTLGLVRTNLRIRKNSILNSVPIGMSPNSPYGKSARTSGDTVSPITPTYQKTATDAKGNKVGWDGAKWVPITP